jgi:hypothetical protein
MQYATVAAAVLVLATGCVAPSAGLDAAGVDAASALPDLAAYDTTFRGKIPLSALGMLGHSRPEEDLLWPVSQVGFLLNLSATPLAYEVRLTQTSAVPGTAWQIMLHSHKAHGTNTYVEHVTEFSTDREACLRVPAADLTAGTWQVMVHSSEETANAEYELKVTTWGIQGRIEPDRHGHGEGAFNVDKHSIEACTGML